jgi:SagB-type dehydrogenase family enzyme
MTWHSDPDSVRAGFSPSPYRDFHVASTLAAAAERLKPTATTTEAERDALAEPGKRYGDGPYERTLAGGDELTIGLDAALAARRSARSFGEREVSFADLSTILAAYRDSAEMPLANGSLALRTAPSAGGLYPVEVYVVPTRVTSLPAGVHHYRPQERALIQVHDDANASERLAKAMLDPGQVPGAAGAIVLSARFERSTAKYSERGYRYVLLEAGHLGQIFALAAVGAGLGMVFHGAFYDRRIDSLLGLDGVNEASLAVLLFGSPDADYTGPRGNPSVDPAPRA